MSELQSEVPVEGGEHRTFCCCPWWCEFCGSFLSSGSKSACGLLISRDQEISSPPTLLITTISPGGGPCKWLWAPCWQRPDLRVPRKHLWRRWQRCYRAVSTKKHYTCCLLYRPQLHKLHPRYCFPSLGRLFEDSDSGRRNKNVHCRMRLFGCWSVWERQT